MTLIKTQYNAMFFTDEARSNWGAASPLNRLEPVHCETFATGEPRDVSKTPRLM